MTLIQEVTKAEDLDKLREITRGILGEICWRANLSYGEELSLHIGARLPYSQKSMAGQEKGEWILGTRGTAWRLDTASETLISSEDDSETIRQKVHAIEGTTITAFETRYPDLALIVNFSNGCQLRLFPNAEDDLDLPYWELFTPARMILQVGLGAKWSYRRSDLPEVSNLRQM